MDIRSAAFAGSWYPRRADACQQEIERYLAQGHDLTQPDQGWTAGIVPHAGWIYSGQIACQVIKLLNTTDPDTPIDVVVIFGMHLHPSSPNHMMAQGAWETPFGELPVAEDLAAHLLDRFAFRLETSGRYIQDNTIEVQLPFVKYLLNPRRILALGVPPAAQSIEIGNAVGQWALQNKQQVKIIGSTDLTHYGPNYDFSPKGRGPDALEWVRNQNDRRVIQAILEMAPERIIEEGLTHSNACCAGAVAAAIAAASQMGVARAHEVAYASSYDRSPGESFVGYVGVVMGPAE